MTKARKFTVQFYAQDGPGRSAVPGEGPSRDLVLQSDTPAMAIHGWPHHHVLVAHATVEAREPLEAATRFVHATINSGGLDREWWQDGNVTLRSEQPPHGKRVRVGDVLAIGHDAEVRLHGVVAITKRKITTEPIGPHKGRVSQCSSVFTVHQEEQHLEAERVQLLQAYANRVEHAETPTELAMNQLLDGAEELVAAVLDETRAPLGLSERDNPLRQRMVALLRIVSQLVATCRLPHLDVGAIQDEIRYVAHRAGVERDMLSGRDPVAYRVPIHQAPPRAGDLPAGLTRGRSVD